VRESVKAPGWASWKTLLSVTACHSFAGEVEASNTPTIRRLTPSPRHQLQAIALCQAYGIPCGLINFREEPVHGDGIKYKDYLLGVDLPYEAPTVVPTDLTTLDVHSFVRDERVDSTIQKRVYTALTLALEYLRHSG
jgi:hypothetical protein